MDSNSSSPKRNNAAEQEAEWEVANPLTLVGGNRPYHVMSVLLAEHSHSRGILGFLTLNDANALRSVCKELRDEVAGFRWKDMLTRINGHLDLWRICFPRAVSADLSNRFDLTDDDFEHLRGIRYLDVSVEFKCSMGLSDASFVHLQGIELLDISFCEQLTDAAFIHLKGIHTLKMDECCQATITDAAFVHLEGIHTLDMLCCNQAAITGSCLHLLLGITDLECRYCSPATMKAAWVVLNASRRLRGEPEVTQYDYIGGDEEEWVSEEEEEMEW